MSTTRRQPTGVLLAFSLAWSGGYIAYTPFLTLLLPIRFTELAGAADRDWLALSATLGAIAAGLSNILWGWLSDRYKPRKAWFGAGLVLTGIACALIWRATTPAATIAAVVAWQTALNMLLGPLAAYFATACRTSRRAPSVACSCSVLLRRRFHSWRGLGTAVAGGAAGNDHGRGGFLRRAIAAHSTRRSDRRRGGPEKVEDFTTAAPTLVGLWVVRLVVQVAEGLLFLFVYYLLRERSGGDLSVAGYALTNAAVQLISVPIALDAWTAVRSNRPTQMAARRHACDGHSGTRGDGDNGRLVADRSLLRIVSHRIEQLPCASLDLCDAEAANPRHYGRDLGFFNLTNTLPSLTTPILAVMVVGQFGYSGLLLGLAVTMFIPAAILVRLRLD